VLGLAVTRRPWWKISKTSRLHRRRRHPDGVSRPPLLPEPTQGRPADIAAGPGELGDRALAEGRASMTMTIRSATVGAENGALDSLGPCRVGEAKDGQQSATASTVGAVSASCSSQQTVPEIAVPPQTEIRVILWDSFPRHRSG
jgi:hypothetical protein